MIGVAGIVHIKGAIATTGSNPVPFTLPAAFRQAAWWTSPWTCTTRPTGGCRSSPPEWSLSTEGGTFSNAACFTSLDGVLYTP
jgi:hypothetical protein